MLLVPGFEHVDLGPDGGPYDERAHPKVCWHTTEGGSLAGAEAAFRTYPPHLGYDPRTRQRRQYVSLDRHSYSLRGAESDDEYVVQVEVVGRADESHAWPVEWYQNIGVDVVRPLRDLIGVPDAHQRFYGAWEGIVLASPRSPIRLSDAAFRAFSGHLGHQHVPAPDEHWDPGAFRIDLAIDASHQEAADMSYEDPDRTRDWHEAYRVRDLAAGHEEVAADAAHLGLAGEPIELNRKINAIAADVAELKARPSAGPSAADVAREIVRQLGGTP